MRRSMLLMTLTMTMATNLALAQSGGAPVPSPFPGAPAPAPSTPRTPPATPPATPPTAPPVAAAPTAKPTAPAAAAAPAAGPNLPGVPIYPAAEYLDTIDAGSGQSYVLYGTTAPYAEIVAYYRTALKNGGREIYRTPGIYQFDLGRFDDARMAYPPSVVVKDYADGTPAGFLFVSGTTEKRFRTVIQIVPVAR